jgi:hypothetical protein
MEDMGVELPEDGAIAEFRDADHTGGFRDDTAVGGGSAHIAGQDGSEGGLGVGGRGQRGARDERGISRPGHRPKHAAHDSIEREIRTNHVRHAAMPPIPIPAGPRPQPTPHPAGGHARRRRLMRDLLTGKQNGPAPEGGDRAAQDAKRQSGGLRHR